MATAKDSRTLRTLALQLAQLEKRVKAVGSGRQLAHSAIEDGALQAYSDGQQVMRIGLQWDGTYAPTVTNGPTPPTPAGVIVADATEAVIVSWDGSFVGGAVAPMDFLRVDVHVGATSDFLPTYANRAATFASPTGGTTGIHLAYGTYFIKLVCWTLAGVPSLASDAVEGDAWPVEVSSDGFAPASSPNPEIFQGIREMYVRWTAITNADPVWYDIHISTTLGFTPDSTTLVGSTQSTAFTIDALPGPAPAEGEEDQRLLDYDTVYYVRIVARDEDGSAAPGLQAVGGVFRVTGINLAVDSVATQHISTGSLVGEHFSATVIYAGTFKTAEAGQRVETGIAGIQGYKSDGSLMINFPTDPEQTALIDAQIIARGLTVTDGMILRATSQIEPDSVVKLNRGITAPQSTPQMSTTYMTRTPETASLTAGQKTGPLGTFDINPSEVTCIEWKESASTWVIHQIRSGGTRAWFFDFDGNPTTWSGVYFADYVNWEIHSVIEITTSTPAKNGVYRMSRWIPNDTYYLQCPQGIGFNRYSRQNGAAAPVVGTNGTDVFVAEVISTDELNIRYFTPNGDGNNLSAPTTLYQSNAGFNVNHPLSTVFYDAGAFDTGSASGRYLVGARGFADKNQLVYTSGTNLGSIHPGGVAAGPSSWSSANKDAETFEAAHINPRCIAWMGGAYDRFWTYAGDGKLYEHTDVFWDPATTSSTMWAQQTFADTVGTTHETTPGPAKSFTWPRRSKVAFSLPPIPVGGAEDPNAVGVYVGRGATFPGNSAMYRQALINSTTTSVEDIDTGGVNPPTVSTFPNTNPGKVTNDNDDLVISGDGSVKALTVVSPGIRIGTTYSGGEDVAVVGPYWHGYLNASPAAVANAISTTITGWVADGSPNSLGITHSAGIFTLPKAGRYRIRAKVWWAGGGTPAQIGNRLTQIMKTSPLTVLDSSTVASSTAGTVPAINIVDKTWGFAAGEQCHIRFSHGDTGSTRAPTGSGPDITWVQITWVGP